MTIVNDLENIKQATHDIWDNIADPEYVDAQLTAIRELCDLVIKELNGSV